MALSKPGLIGLCVRDVTNPAKVKWLHCTKPHRATSAKQLRYPAFSRQTKRSLVEVTFHFFIRLFFSVYRKGMRALIKNMKGVYDCIET